MRTTLDIEDDILQAAKELAAKDGSTAGRVLSALARRGLAGSGSSRGKIRNGVMLVPSRNEIVTLEKLGRLMDEEGI